MKPPDALRSPDNLKRESAVEQELAPKTPKTTARSLKYEDLAEILAALRHDHQSIEMYPVVLEVIHVHDQLQDELENLYITKRRVRQMIADIIFAHNQENPSGEKS